MSDFTSPDLPFSPPFPFPLSGRVGQLQLTCPAFPQRRHLILLMSTVQDPAVCLLLPHFPHLPSATVSTPNSYSVFPSREFNFLPVPVDSKSLNSRCCSSPPASQRSGTIHGVRAAVVEDIVLHSFRQAFQQNN